MGWLKAHHPLRKAEWVKLFRQTFRFTGGEIVGEFLHEHRVAARRAPGELSGVRRRCCSRSRHVPEA